MSGSRADSRASTPVTEAREIVVLYVEDDLRLGHLTSQYLRSHGLTTHLVERGDQALAAILRIQPDVVLLDLMLPGLDGLQICRKLRELLDVPIIMVSARSDERDRIAGLEIGADDYVVKPFSPRELLARVQAQTRRRRGQVGPRATQLVVGPLCVDAERMCASIHGTALALSHQEFALLRALAQSPSQVLSREQLLLVIHGSEEEAFDRSIDVHISRLRQKLGDSPRNPRMLRTVRGLGYMLVEPGS
jgi:DNA-binding response OmpR family regulator